MKIKQLTHQENKLKLFIHDFQSTFRDLEWEKEKFAYAEERITQEDKFLQMENTKELEEKLETLGASIYKLMIAYLETQGFTQLLLTFMAEVGPIVNDRKELVNGIFDRDSGDCFSSFISVLWTYLTPFPTFGENDLELLNEKLLVYLEHILESTGMIIQTIGAKIIRETDIIKKVKFVCQAVFPTAQFPTTAFIKAFKHYIPDILIPHLQTAVEYKFAQSESDLVNTIDEILIDVQGYNDNPSYNTFYAVFYVPAGMCPRIRFDKAWAEKAFPDNWKPIYVEGPIESFITSPVV